MSHLSLGCKTHPLFATPQMYILITECLCEDEIKVSYFLVILIFSHNN